MGFLVLFLTVSGLVHAADSGKLVDPDFRPGTTLLNPQDFRTVKENNPSGSAAVEADPAQVESSRADGWRAWVGDHAKGLLLGFLTGLGVGIGLVVLGSLLAISAPVWGVVVAGAVLSGALYGLFTGATRFNVVDCIVQSVIGGVSAGVGYGLGVAGTLAGRSLVAAKVAVDVVAGGLGSMGSYLVQTPDPTWSGAAVSFGTGAGTAGLFLGLGYGLAKLKTASQAAKGLGKATEAVAEAAPSAARPAAKAASAAAPTKQATAQRPRRSGSASAGATAARKRAGTDPLTDLAKAPASVKGIFAEALESGSAAERQQALNAYRDGVVAWARRNPYQSNEVAKSGAGLSGLVEAAQKAPKWSPPKLEGNMKAKFGLSKPDGYAVHHIVAGQASDAEKARRVLQRFKIDINDADNGVFLPNKPGVGTTEAYHRTLHTPQYHRNVLYRLNKASDEASARDILAEIAQELTAGTFPK